VTVERATVTVTGTQAPVADPATTAPAALTPEPPAADGAGITVTYFVEVEVP